jgi:hypothetical protein
MLLQDDKLLSGEKRNFRRGPKKGICKSVPAPVWTQIVQHLQLQHSERDRDASYALAQLYHAAQQVVQGTAYIHPSANPTTAQASLPRLAPLRTSESLPAARATPPRPYDTTQHILQLGPAYTHYPSFDATARVPPHRLAPLRTSGSPLAASAPSSGITAEVFQEAFTRFEQTVTASIATRHRGSSPSQAATTASGGPATAEATAVQQYDAWIAQLEQKVKNLEAIKRNSSYGYSATSAPSGNPFPLDATPRGANRANTTTTMPTAAAARPTYQSTAHHIATVPAWTPAATASPGVPPQHHQEYASE